MIRWARPSYDLAQISGKDNHHDGRLSDSRWTYESGIILRSSTEDLDGPSNFIISTYDRVKFPLSGKVCQIYGVLFQSFARCGLLVPEVETKVSRIVVGWSRIAAYNDSQPGRRRRKLRVWSS